MSLYGDHYHSWCWKFWWERESAIVSMCGHQLDSSFVGRTTEITNRAWPLNCCHKISDLTARSGEVASLSCRLGLSAFLSTRVCNSYTWLMFSRLPARNSTFPKSETLDLRTNCGHSFWDKFWRFCAWGSVSRLLCSLSAAQYSELFTLHYRF